MVRPKRGERRIDAAIDHLAEYGFPKPHIRRTINSLLQLYGRDGWVFLEEGSYRVVLEKLLEERAQQQQKDQQQEEAAADEDSPENDKQVSQEQSEAPTKSQPALEQQASLNSTPSLQSVLPLPPAIHAAPARPPCRGWISDESESEPEDGEIFSDIPSPVQSLPPKRKRPSRWDVLPN